MHTFLLQRKTLVAATPRLKEHSTAALAATAISTPNHLPPPTTAIATAAFAAANCTGLEDGAGFPVSMGVLCFDEVQMMDIADATIVNGILHRRIACISDVDWLAFVVGE